MATPTEEELLHILCDLAQKADDCSITIGSSFTLYDELYLRIEKYEASHYCKFWKRDSRTIEAAQKCTNKNLRKELFTMKILTVVYMVEEGL